MSKGGWTRLGKAELAVIRYLSVNPNLNITQIREGLGYTHHSSIAKATKSLDNKELVKELSKYRVKGREVIRWGLTFKGYVEAAENGVDVAEMFQKYQKYDKDLEFPAKVNDVLTSISPRKWRRDRNDRLVKLLKAIKALDDIGIFTEKAVSYIFGGFFADWILSNLSEKERRKFIKAFPNAQEYYAMIYDNVVKIS